MADGGASLVAVALPWNWRLMTGIGGKPNGGFWREKRLFAQRQLRAFIPVNFSFWLRILSLRLSNFLLHQSEQRSVDVY